MAQNILLKRSSVTGKTPSTGSLQLGELAINTYDGKIHFKKSGSVESIQSIVTTDCQTTGSITLTGSGSFSSLKVNNTLTVNHGESIISGSALVTNDLTVLGAVNARQFNISIISSSVLFESGSSNFGNSADDTHSFTGSVQIEGAITASTFVGDGSGLTNLAVDISTAQLNEVDGNNIPARSFAELFVACAVAEIVDLDFGA